jgi:hypothetical protein
MKADRMEPSAWPMKTANERGRLAGCDQENKDGEEGVKR